MASVASKLTTSPQQYSRLDTLRLLKLSDRQLTNWEQQHLIRPSDQYGFTELVALRAILKLRKSHRPATQIHRAIDAIKRKLSHVSDPLTQLSLYVDGKRIRVEVDGRAMEAESGQLLLNFDAVELNRLLEFRAPNAAAVEKAQERDRRAAAEQCFQRGLELEQTGAPMPEIVAAYQDALALDPNSAGVLVNLGTIYFNSRNWREAERYYKSAITADQNYALAHFDIANLFDERGDRVRAIEHYQTALRLHSGYADAHYNLALLFQATNQTMKAVRHWTAYLKLDRSSQWAGIARRELTKLRQAAVVQGSRQ
ncbi:MAG: tetratricopeptide repeat protein [Acidobacteriota bacterium]